MTQAACEIIYIYHLLGEVDLKALTSTSVFCDNQAALYIVSNLVFFEWS